MLLLNSPLHFLPEAFDPYEHRCDELPMKDFSNDSEKSYAEKMFVQSWELVCVMQLGFTTKYYYWERVRYPITVSISEYVAIHFETKKDL